MKKFLLKSMRCVLDMVLFSSANTASTGICFQPKAPLELNRYKKD